jgi:hypothetical protein
VEGKARGCGFYQSKGQHEKNQKNWGCLKNYKYQFIYFKTRKYGGVPKNKMPTLMGFPYFEASPKHWRKKIRCVKCLPIKTSPLCL